MNKKRHCSTNAPAACSKVGARTVSPGPDMAGLHTRRPHGSTGDTFNAESVGAELAGEVAGEQLVHVATDRSAGVDHARPARAVEQVAGVEADLCFAVERLGAPEG